MHLEPIEPLGGPAGMVFVSCASCGRRSPPWDDAGEEGWTVDTEVGVVGGCYCPECQPNNDAGNADPHQETCC